MADERVDLQECSRKNRRECLTEVGEERFGFERKFEVLKYKYVTFERLTRKEWEQCQRCIKCMKMPHKYPMWRGEIREKYIGHSLTDLLDFKSYLELCARKRKGLITTKNREIEINMYKDYQKVIDELIEFKRE